MTLPVCGNYIGGKGSSGVVQLIINQMPPHKTYIEAFLGSGRVLATKRPAARNIGLENSASAIAAFGGRVPQSTIAYTIIKGDAISWLRAFKFSGDELIYADPPYVLGSLGELGRQYYENDFVDRDHINLLRILDRVPCPVILSGYPSELYNRLLVSPKWRCVTYHVQTRRHRWATECLWMNFPQPVELHDYRFLGPDYRERERIKKKVRRWVTKFKTMPTQERYAMFAAIRDAFEPSRIDPEWTGSGHTKRRPAATPEKPVLATSRKGRNAKT